MKKILWLVLFFILVTVVIWFLSSAYEKQSFQTWQDSCDTINPCTTCDVTVSCLKILEQSTGKDLIRFRLDNKKNATAVCSAHIIIMQNNVEFTQTQDVGQVLGHDFVYVSAPLQFPGGESDIMIDPSCVWE